MTPWIDICLVTTFGLAINGSDLSGVTVFLLTSGAELFSVVVSGTLITFSSTGLGAIGLVFSNYIIIFNRISWLAYIVFVTS